MRAALLFHLSVQFVFDELRSSAAPPDPPGAAQRVTLRPWSLAARVQGPRLCAPRARRDSEAGAHEKRAIDVLSRNCPARAPRCTQDVCRGRMSLLPDVYTFTPLFPESCTRVEPMEFQERP